MKINSLYLDSELIEDDLRAIIKSAIRDKEVINKFSEIYLIPMNVDIHPDSRLPAISIEVQKNGVYKNTQEDIQVEPYSQFDVIVETYTNGEDKRRKNIQLAQFVIGILQTNQQLEHFYNRGLRLDQERELSSVVNGVNRRQIRFSGVVDNEHKLILNKF